MTKIDSKRRKAKFRVGQVVILANSELRADVPQKVKSFDGVFYKLHGSEDLSWRENELRPLTKREAGR